MTLILLMLSFLMCFVSMCMCETLSVIIIWDMGKRCILLERSCVFDQARYSEVPPAGPYLNKNVSLRFFIPCNVNPNPEPVWSSGYVVSNSQAKLLSSPSTLAKPNKEILSSLWNRFYYYYYYTYSSKRIMNLCKDLQPKFPSIYWTWTLL